MTETLRLADFMRSPLPATWERDQNYVWRGPEVHEVARFVVAMPNAPAQVARWGKRRRGPLFVVVSIDDDTEAGIWLHSSVSRQGRLPTWEELKLVKGVVHQDRPAIQLFPPRAHWISISDCLHLFERLDGATVPESLWRMRR